MIGGTAVQYKAGEDARKRAKEETLRSLANQRDFQQKAEKKALGQAEEFNTDRRMTDQQAIETQLNDEFIKPVESAQQINSAVATTQGDVSGDYTRAKAQSDLNLMKNARTLAGLMAKTTAAGRLRTNEAIRMADTAAGIDRLGSFSRGQAGADQLAIQDAARPDAGMQLIGGLLQAGGGAYLASGAGAAKGVTGGGTGVGATASTAGTTAAPIAGSTTGGVGFSGVGRTGLRLPKSFAWG
jgi:hypothetical protein